MRQRRGGDEQEIEEPGREAAPRGECTKGSGGEAELDKETGVEQTSFVQTLRSSVFIHPRPIRLPHANFLSFHTNSRNH